MSLTPRQSLWFLAALILTLIPTWLPVLWPHISPGPILTSAHLLGLLLLPCAFGLRPRRLLQLLWPALLLSPFALACYLSTHCQPSEWYLLVLLETNTSEMSAFVPQIAGGTFALIILFSFYRYALRQLPLTHHLPRYLTVAALLLALAPPLAKTVKDGPALAWKDEQWRLLGHYPANLITSIGRATQIHHQLSNRSDLSQNLEVTSTAPPLPPQHQRQIHLLVIGEASRASALQINGATRETTPQLASTPRLTNYSNAASAAPVTALAVPLLLTPAKAPSSATVGNLPSLMNVYRQAGFRVHWLSTQPQHGAHDTRCSMFARDAHESHFISGKYDPQGISLGLAHDHSLLPLVEAILARKNEPRTLIVLHTLGSHMPYIERYPAEYNHFTAAPSSILDAQKGIPAELLTSDNLRNLTNAYDNTLRYTDAFLAKLIGQLDATNHPATLLYVSDHGENPGTAPLLPFGHGVLTTACLHVPLITWTSPEYEAWLPAKVAALSAHRDSPVSTTATFHTMLDLAGLGCSLFDPNQSLACSGYTPSPRLVIGIDGRISDYDRDVLKPELSRPGWRPFLSQRTQ